MLIQRISGLEKIARNRSSNMYKSNSTLNASCPSVKMNPSFGSLDPEMDVFEGAISGFKDTIEGGGIKWRADRDFPPLSEKYPEARARMLRYLDSRLGIDYAPCHEFIANQSNSDMVLEFLKQKLGEDAIRAKAGQFYDFKKNKGSADVIADAMLARKDRRFFQCFCECFGFLLKSCKKK